MRPTCRAFNNQDWAKSREIIKRGSISPAHCSFLGALQSAWPDVEGSTQKLTTRTEKLSPNGYQNLNTHNLQVPSVCLNYIFLQQLTVCSRFVL